MSSKIDKIKIWDTSYKLEILSFNKSCLIILDYIRNTN